MGILSNTPAISGRSNGLDALRAILALWVVSVHIFPLTEALRGVGSAPRIALQLVSFATAITQTTGELNSAVIVFIVLSGYCIHRSGFREDRRDVMSYAVRRAARILPIFYFAFFVGVAIGRKSQEPSWACIVAHATTISTLTSKFSSCELGNGPLPTVIVEIVLYALYALAFWLLAWRGREKWIWYGCGLATVLSFIVAARESSDPSFYNWCQNMSLLGFIPFWWIGAAFVNPTIAKTARRWLPFSISAYVITTAAVLALTSFQTKGTVEPLASIISQARELVLAVLAGILIVKLESVKMSWRNPLAVLGRASYSLYALNSPVNYFLITREVSWPAIMAADIAMALVSYALIERCGIALGRVFLTSRIMVGIRQPELEPS